MRRISLTISLFLCAVFPHAAWSQNSTFLKAAANRSGLSEGSFNSRVCDSRTDPVAARVLREYGAVFVATEGVLVPSKCIYENGSAVDEFQSRAKLSRQRIGTIDITLQSEAMSALNSAIKDANAARLRITPRKGSIAGIRGYQDTVRLWNSRFNPALAHWQGNGKIAKHDADAARKVSAFEQVPLVLNWEESGFWFSTGFSRTILSSVAAPGTSQHLSGLALDVTEFANARVRSILNKHGWFQTVADDTPHFTYLGRAEVDLPKFGLILLEKNSYKFWIPAMQ